MPLKANLLMNIRKISRCLLLLGCGFAASLLSSCSNDMPEPEIPDSTEEFYITISLPKIGFGNDISRASDPIDNTDMHEGDLQSLYLAVFTEDVDYPGTYNLTFFEDIKGSETINSSLTSGYDKDYRLNLTEGNYKFYLLGNIFEYWKHTQSGDPSGDDFKEAIKTEWRIRNNLNLSFTGLIAAGNLPMVCFPENIMTSASDESSLLPDGIFSVTPKMIEDFQGSADKTPLTLFAPMSILCSKVRFTVLFDNCKSTDHDSFSSSFPEADISLIPNNSVDGEVTFSNIYKKTALLPLASDYQYEFAASDWLPTQNESIYKTKYPSEETNTSGYFTITTQTESPKYLDRLYTEDWIKDEDGIAHHRAWQGGAIYLPETTSAMQGTDHITTLHLNTWGTGVEDGYDIKIPDMKRGTFYDIVAKLKQSNVLEIEIYVQVNPWTYNPQPEEW